METLAQRIRRRAEERKQSEFKGYQLVPVSAHCYKGMTASGKEVTFEGITFGMTEQGLYGAGTLKCEGKTIFTKGYPSRALAWMASN